MSEFPETEAVACRHCGYGVHRVTNASGGTQWTHIGSPDYWYCKARSTSASPDVELPETLTGQVPVVKKTWP